MWQACPLHCHDILPQYYLLPLQLISSIGTLSYNVSLLPIEEAHNVFLTTISTVCMVWLWTSLTWQTQLFVYLFPDLPHPILGRFGGSTDTDSTLWAHSTDILGNEEPLVSASPPDVTTGYEALSGYIPTNFILIEDSEPSYTNGLYVLDTSRPCIWPVNPCKTSLADWGYRLRWPDCGRSITDMALNFVTGWYSEVICDRHSAWDKAATGPT